MPTYALNALLATACCLVVAALLLVKSRRQAWTLSLLLFTLGFWLASPVVGFYVPSLDPLFLMRLSYIPVVFAALWTLTFAITTLHQRFTRRPFILSWILGLELIVLVSRPLFIDGVEQTPLGWQPIPEYGFWALALYTLATGAFALYASMSKYRSGHVWQTNRLKWLALAWLLAGAGAVAYLLGVATGYEPISHDFFLMAFALTIGYAILWRRLYEIELLTRGAACTVVTAILAALPLLLGRVFAPIVWSLPSVGQFEAVCTLLATLSFFAIAVALVRYSERNSTRNFSRLFLFAAWLNAAYFVWAVPHNAFSIPVLRLTYLLMGGVMMSWVEYRRSYFDEDRQERRYSFYNLWRYASYGWLVVAAGTPYVLRGLEYYHTSRRPFSIIPGPAHLWFHLWWALSFSVVAVWTVFRFWRLYGRTHKLATATLAGTTLAGALTLASGMAFGLGVMQWPWQISFETLTAAGALTTFLIQPRPARHPTSKMLVSLFAATLVSCLSGFLLFQGLLWQLLACVLIAIAMPMIVSQFRDSAQALVDQYLFRQKFSYLSEIQQMGDDIFRFTNLPGLLRRLAEELASRSRLVWAGIWLFDLSEGRFLLRRAAGRQNTQLDASSLFKLSFKPDDALLQCFREERGLIIADELRALAGDHKLEKGSIESRALDQLRHAGLAAAFPLYLGTKVIGFLGVGAKEDHSVFHQGDREALSNLGRKSERAVGQAYMLYEQSLMFSKLAHDTLNFLQAMGMNMDILSNEFLGPLNDRQKKQLNIAAHQRELIRESLVDLRELERLMVLRMQGTWQMVPFGLKEIVEESVEAFRSRAAAQNLTLTQDAQSMVQALGEPRAVRRVIDNLIVNALKFTPAGGHVALRQFQKGDNLVFMISDTGPGIPEKELPRIFDPFYQASNTTAIPRGTGLGLSVVKEIVALHKGRLDVESVLGKGTAFTLEFPSVLRLKEFQPAEPIAQPSILSKS